MSTPSFTRCPHCGQSTARSVEVCIRCGHRAAPESTRGNSLFGVLILAAVIGSLGFALWWFVFAKPSPLVGTWAKGGIRFTFEPDGDLQSNGLFQPNGNFVLGTKRITWRWRTTGNRLTLVPQSSQNKISRDVEWEVSGKTLTLRGVDSIGTIKSTLRLTRSDSGPASSSAENPSRK